MDARKSPSNLSHEEAWQILEAHFSSIKDMHLRELFAKEKNRAQTYRIQHDGLLLDYSKNRITALTVKELINLARASGLEDARDAMFAGEKINTSENRAALHTALRAEASERIEIDGENVVPLVHGVLDRIKALCERVHSQKWTGATGKPIRHIVNIGIGGSHAGPRMATEALRQFHQKGLEAHYVSNVDGADLHSKLDVIEPETSLFVVVSKSFTTRETLTNARAAREWLIQALGEDAVARHFVAVSTNIRAAKDFGITEDNILGFWDWVGGRYSLWSAAGLSTALMIGWDNFKALLGGARSMDRHFRDAPMKDNMPVILGLLAVWYNNFHDAPAQAVLPYAYDLRYLNQHLQQLVMESIGKRAAQTGEDAPHDTSPIIFGEVGTDGQHAFYQLMHQGTKLIPADFIGVARPLSENVEQHRMLLANLLAQSAVLMNGRDDADVRAALKASGKSEKEIDVLAPQMVLPGNQPSTTILLEALDPHRLGMLIALYEHKTFVQSVIWKINAFDQWGVETGKKIADSILPVLESFGQSPGFDSSTNNLIEYLRDIWKDKE